MRLTASGSASVAQAELVLWAEGLPAEQWALLIAGTSAVAGGASATFGDGLGCVGGSVRRLALARSDASGMLYFGAQALGGASDGGARSLYFQVVYRDPGAGSYGAGYNTSHGLAVEYRP